MSKLIYVCDGGDCSEKGSVEFFERLRARLHEKDPGEESIKIRKYPCFGGCEQGINVTVWPDRVFYSTVVDSDIEAIAKHIENDEEPVKRLIGKVRPDVEELLWEILDSPY